MSDSVKKYYSIGEVAQQLDVSTSLIRFWEKKFPFIQPYKNSQGIRMFTVENISQLKRIYHLVKEKGYTLDGAKKEFKKTSNMSNVEEIIATLKSIKAFLEKINDESRV